MHANIHTNYVYTRLSHPDGTLRSHSFSDSLKSTKSEENYLGSGDDDDDDEIDDDEDDGNEFVTINVSGKRYETRWNTLKSKY